MATKKSNSTSRWQPTDEEVRATRQTRIELVSTDILRQLERAASDQARRMCFVDYLDGVVLAKALVDAMRGRETPKTHRHRKIAGERAKGFAVEQGASFVRYEAAGELVVRTDHLLAPPRLGHLEARDLVEAWERGRGARRTAHKRDVWEMIATALSAHGLGEVQSSTLKTRWSEWSKSNNA